MVIIQLVLKVEGEDMTLIDFVVLGEAYMLMALGLVLFRLIFWHILDGGFL